VVLKTLQENEKKDKTLPDNEVLSQIFQGISDLSKHMKKIMPFVQMIKEMYEKCGASALSLTSEFDESAVLKENMEYIMSSLELEGVELKDVTEAALKNVEECYPGKPLIVLRTERSIPVKCINPQPSNGLFDMSIQILADDNVAKVASRICKLNRNIKRTNKVELWREVDILSRKIPNLSNIYAGKMILNPTDLLKIDFDTEKIHVIENGNMFDIGTILFYFVS